MPDTNIFALLLCWAVSVNKQTKLTMLPSKAFIERLNVGSEIRAGDYADD